MGAAAGQQACIANVIRICARYGNLDILEDGYGINLLPLATFALRMYKDDPCSCFSLKGPQRSNQAEMETDLRIAQGDFCDPVLRSKVRRSADIRNLEWKNAHFCIGSIMKKGRSLWTEKNIRCRI